MISFHSCPITSPFSFPFSAASWHFRFQRDSVVGGWKSSFHSNRIHKCRLQGDSWGYATCRAACFRSRTGAWQCVAVPCSLCWAGLEVRTRSNRMDGWIYGWLVPRSNRIRQGNKNTRELQSGMPALPMGKKEKEPWMGGSRRGHGQSIVGLLFGPCNVTGLNFVTPLKIHKPSPLDNTRETACMRPTSGIVSLLQLNVWKEKKKPWWNNLIGNSKSKFNKLDKPYHLEAIIIDNPYNNKTLSPFSQIILFKWDPHQCFSCSPIQLYLPFAPQSFDTTLHQLGEVAITLRSHNLRVASPPVRGPAPRALAGAPPRSCAWQQRLTLWKTTTLFFYPPPPYGKKFYIQLHRTPIRVLPIPIYLCL